MAARSKPKKNISVVVKSTSFILILCFVIFSNTFLIILKELFNLGEYNARNYEAILSTIPLSIIVTLLLIDGFNLLNFRYVSNMAIFRRVFYFTIIQTLATTTIAFFSRQFSYPRSTILIGYGILFVLTFAWSLLAKLIYDHFSVRRNILVVYQDQAQLAGTLAEIKRNREKFGFDQVIPVEFSSIEKLSPMIKDQTDIFVTNDLDISVRNEIVLLAKAHNGFVFVVPNSYELSLKSAENIQINDILLFTIHHNELSLEKKIFKRIFDLAFSIVALLLSSPILIVIALVVKLSSSGPVIFKQERVTRNFQRFNIYKFRTMYDNAEKLTGPIIAGENDPRITPVGRVLRRFRLDELPQFFNVVKGDMSVVGPRAERMVFIEQFLKDVNGYALRYKVKAGITGLAQIFGNYDSSAENKLRFDLSYINDYSLLSDIRLIFLTLKKMIV